MLFDGASLAPVAVLDGAALTAVRTAAVSAFAARALATPAASRLVVFGSGPQAEAHVQAIRSVRPLREVTVVGRDAGRAGALAARLADDGLPGHCRGGRERRAPPTSSCARRLPASRSSTATGSARRPASWPSARTSPMSASSTTTVFRRAGLVVVEDVATAMREAGDVIRAVGDGAIRPDQLVGLSRLDELAEAERVDQRPVISVFKSVGMGWQDLAIASATVRGFIRSPARPRRV